MYQKPALQKYGSFKDLTQSGFGGAGDGCIVLDPVTGAVVDGNPGDGSVAPFCGRS